MDSRATSDLGLQEYDSKELEDMKEYQYKRIQGGKRRIRLIKLKTGHTDNREIVCEFHEAEYDTTFHIPRKITPDQETGAPSRNTEDEDTQTSPQPEDHQGDVDVDEAVTRDQEATHKREKLHQLMEARKALQQRSRKQREDMEKKEEEEEMERFKEAQKNGVDYEALSWCWGSDEPKYALKIEEGDNTYKFRVKRELALALKYLRLKDKVRTLWIDAICINQSDPEERNHQVQMMSRIYTRAKSVCVWLGEHTEESKIAIDFIRTEVMELDNFDKICTDKKYSRKWQALQMLMQTEWFSRRWVIQEIALAKQATVYCGNDSMPWKDFAIAVELFVEVETATHRLSEIMQNDEKFRHVPNWFEHVSELGASLLVQATGKVFRGPASPLHDLKGNKEDSKLDVERWSRIRTIDPLERRSLLSLEYLVSTMFIFKAAEPRDVIYSLLAIARDAAPFAGLTFDDEDPTFLTMTLFDQFLEEKPFVIDYSRPYSDVCRDFVRFVVQRKSKIDAVQALDILCRPWSLEKPKDEKSIRLRPQHDEDFDNTYNKGIIPKQDNRTWYRRISGFDREIINGKPRWRLAKKRDDPRVPDNRTTEEYRDQYETDYKAKKTWLPLPSRQNEEWRPAPGWDKLEEWCRIYRKEMKAAVEKRRTEKEEKEKRTKDKGPNNVDESSDDQDEVKDLQLPSWVARASRAPFKLDNHPGMKVKKMGRANADPLVGQPTDGHRNYSAAQTRHVNLEVLKFRKRPELGHYSMYVQGFILDEVLEVRDASQGGDIPASWLDLGDWEPPYDKDPPDGLWRTLVADRGRDNRNPPYYYARACRESVHKGSITSGRVNTGALIYNERNSIVAEFCRRVHAVIWNRRMFKTTAGRLGLAYDVEKGDKICVLYGCTVPVVLKQMKKEEGNLASEKLEDAKEALKACIRQCEKNRERKKQRKSRNDKNKKRWMESGEWYEMMDAKEKAEDKLERERARKKDEEAAEAAEATEVTGEAEEPEDPVGRVEPEGLGEIEEAGELEEADTLGDAEAAGETGEAEDIAAAAEEDHQSEQHVDHGAMVLDQISASLFVTLAMIMVHGVVQNGQAEIAEVSSSDHETPKLTYQEKVEQAERDDPHLFYKFRGDCYLHGMMDGEAVRHKFYEELPDRVFELR
ncbi:hypothetical protein PG984_010423 [Apiospora sp. TS-2023a]